MAAVHILLLRVSGDDALDERDISLGVGSSLQIGRASKTEHKRLVPALHNCWIKNPVISRNHAILSVAMESSDVPTLYICDSGSSHNTFVNEKGIKGKGKWELSDGDSIQFGDSVDKLNESGVKITFQPPVYKLGVFKPLGRQISLLASESGRTIECPDDFSEKESELDEDSESEQELDSVSVSSPPEASPTIFNRSSLPGSYENPVTIADEVAAPKVIIDLDSREVSEEYEPSVHIPVVEMNTAVYSRSKEYGYGPRFDMDMESDLDEFNSNQYDAFQDEDDNFEEYADSQAAEPAQSPIYKPVSPEWVAADIAPHFPPLSAVAQTVPMHSNSLHFYKDGPFARPEFGDRCGTNSVPRRWGMQTEHKSGVTVSTQDLLQSAKQNEMSINNIINPAPLPQGVKRKADEFDFQEMHQEFNERLEVLAAANEQADDFARVHEQGAPVAAPSSTETNTELVVPATTSPIQARPIKRMRTARSYASGMATGLLLGAIGAVAGLTALPDGFFA